MAGSLPGQGWNGVANDDEFRDLIFRYPEVIMFNGHSHWTMDSENNVWHQDNKPIILNTAATAYLWTSYNIAAGENLNGSQGYYLYVYKDRIIVRGRDFETGKWIPAAQYCFTGFDNPIKTADENVLRSGTIRIFLYAGMIILSLLIAAAIIIIALKRKKRYNK